MHGVSDQRVDRLAGVAGDGIDRHHRAPRVVAVEAKTGARVQLGALGRRPHGRQLRAEDGGRGRAAVGGQVARDVVAVGVAAQTDDRAEARRPRRHEQQEAACAPLPHVVGGHHRGDGPRLGARQRHVGEVAAKLEARRACDAALEVDEEQPHRSRGGYIAELREHAVSVVARERERAIVDDAQEAGVPALVGSGRAPAAVDRGQEEHVQPLDGAVHDAHFGRSKPQLSRNPARRTNAANSGSARMRS